MDALSFWTVIGLLTTACGGGFLYLSRIGGNNRTVIDRHSVEMANRPTFKEVADDYVRKEVNELQFKSIEKDIQLVLSKLDKMDKKEDA